MFLELKEILEGGHLDFEYPWLFWLLLLPVIMVVLPPLKYRSEALFTPYFKQILKIKNEKPSKGVQIARRNIVALIMMYSLYILSWIRCSSTGSTMTSLAFVEFKQNTRGLLRREYGTNMAEVAEQINPKPKNPLYGGVWPWALHTYQ